MINVTFNNETKALAPFVEAGYFGPAEIHGADLIARAITSQPSYFDLLSVATALGVTQLGHVCADLFAMDQIFTPGSETEDRPNGISSSAMWPDPQEWEQALHSSPLVHLPSSWFEPSSIEKPLVYFERRLFLARQWDDERSVARILTARLRQPALAVDAHVVERLFAGDAREDLQVDAVRKSLLHRTSILLGGPGTGKTYTIARMLAANIAVHAGQFERPMRIALVAPTAKAATRMRESLLGAIAVEGHPFTPEQREIMQQVEPTTIHRLLGRRAHTRTRFAHDERNSLERDLIIIDEMSMVSLPLMARFLEALDPTTNLVLVGDPDQLASVENGSILPDLSVLQESFAEQTTRLIVSRRNFQTASSAFTDAVRVGDANRALEILSSPDEPTLTWIENEDGLRGASGKISSLIDQFKTVRTWAGANHIDKALDEAAKLRLVCAHRRGDYGVADWSRFIADQVSHKSRTWTVGQIVVKTRNDAINGLANGDSGLVVSVDGRLSFAFRIGTELIIRPTSAVDDVELAFATTVHKAQGSEFETVVVVVPPRISPLSTRELLYTAATRAKPHLVLIGSRADIRHAIDTRQPRFTGLVNRLLHAGPK